MMKTKKLLISFILIISCLLVLNVCVFADNDPVLETNEEVTEQLIKNQEEPKEEPKEEPQVKLFSSLPPITESNPPSDTVDITIDIDGSTAFDFTSEDTYVVDVSVTQSPSDSTLDWGTISFTQSESVPVVDVYVSLQNDGKMHGVLSLNKYLTAGTYTANGFVFYSGTSIINTNAAGDTSFTVSGTTPDIEAPVVESIVFSQSEITAPGRTEIIVSATDAISGISDGFFVFKNSKTEDFIYGSVNILDDFGEPYADGKMHGWIDIDYSVPSGIYELVAYQCFDVAGNSSFIFEPQIEASFTVINNGPPMETEVIDKRNINFNGSTASISINKDKSYTISIFTIMEIKNAKCNLIQFMTEDSVFEINVDELIKLIDGCTDFLIRIVDGELQIISNDMILVILKAV